MRGQGGRRGTRRVLCTLLLGALIPALGASPAQAAIAINDVAVNESNGQSSATFTVTRTAGILSPGATVAYATVDGSARAPGDYTATSGSLSFAGLPLGGTQSQQITVTVNGDALDEAAETFAVVLSGEGIADGSGQATITDDDPPPVVRVLDAAPAAEGATALFTVALSAPSGRDVAVAFATANGSAVAGQDYTARSGTVTIAAGATSAQVGVALTDDGADEPNETFELRLGSPSGATLGDATATATIVDDDEPPAAPAHAPPPPPAPPIGSPPASLPTAPSTSGSSTGGGTLQFGLSSPRLRLPATVLVTVSCPRAAGRCTGRVTIFSRPNRRSKIKALRAERRLARRSFGLVGGSSRTLQMQLSRRDRVLLKRAGRMNVRAYVVTTDGAGRTGVRTVNGVLVGRTTHG